MWPNCWFNINIRATKCLNGSARPYWRIMLVWKITTDVQNNNESEHAACMTWLITAIWGQCQNVYIHKKKSDRIIHYYMCATRHAFIPFCSMHPESLAIRVPLNGDQLCGHVYTHLAYTYLVWPNYSNHYSRQQIKVSWDYGYLSGWKCSQRSTASALISKQFSIRF